MQARTPGDDTQREVESESLPADNSSALPSAVRQQLAAAERLHELSSQLIQADDAEALYQRILDTAVAIMRADFGSIQLLDPARGELRLLDHRGFGDRKFREWVHPTSRTTSERALSTRERVVVPDVLRCEWMEVEDQQRFLEMGIRSSQTTPLVSRSGSVIGMISTHWRPPHAPSRGDQRMMDLLARQAADLIDRMRAEETLRESEAREQFLLKLMDALRPLSDPVEIQHTAARVFGERLGASRAFYSEIVDEEESIISRDWTSGVPSIAGRRRLAMYGEQALALARAGKLVIDDVEADPRLTEQARAAFGSTGTAALMSTSLVKGGRWLGTFSVQSSRPRSWTQAEIALLQEVGQRTWAAVERARAEQQLRASETRLSMATDAARMFAWEVDVPSGRMLWSANAASVIGCRPEELPPDISEDRPLFFITPEERPRLLRELPEAIARGADTYRREFRGPGPAFRYYRMDARITYDAAGSAARVMGVTQDVTERKRAEEELRRANAQLEESDRRKSEFLAVLSHELRTPLAPLRNSIILLERASPGSREAERARETIHRQTDHLARLVDDLLDMTRINRGKIELRRARLDLVEVVRRTADDLRPGFDAAGIRLQVEPTAAPVWVGGDAVRLAQVVGNLLQNAAKFTPSGGSVSVSLLADGARATLAVRDTGAGIAPEEVERIFEPFAQGAQDSARTKGGLGLGLSLVKGLVELHGGSVRVSSGGTDHWSEFVVALPTTAAPAAADEQRPNGGASRAVLIVEDQIDAGQSLADVLMLSGHSVRVARDARSGLEVAREMRPDVILCDIGLPDVDGYEFARAARSDAALRTTRLIALTGYALPEDRARALEAGFDAHLPKPPPLEELDALLRA